MLVSNSEEKIAKVRFWATQSRDPAKHYQHSELCFNYRMQPFFEKYDFIGEGVSEKIFENGVLFACLVIQR